FAPRLASLARDTTRFGLRGLGENGGRVEWPAMSEASVRTKAESNGLPRGRPARERRPNRVVRKGGFEPPRSCERQPLKLVRLPVPPLPQVGPAEAGHYVRGYFGCAGGCCAGGCCAGGCCAGGCCCCCGCAGAVAGGVAGVAGF